MDSSDSEDDSRFVYFSTNEETREEDYDKISGRKLRVGEFVSSVSDPHKRGQVVNINRSFGMYDQTDYTLRDVPSDQLHRITKFRVGDLVVLANWLGRVYYVSHDMVVKFEDGGPLRTVRGGAGVKPVQSDWDISDELVPPHPGQELLALASRRRCTLTKVFDAYVLVNWIASCDNNNSPDTPLDAPPDKQGPDSLTLVDSLSPPIWEIGDVCHHASYLETVFLLVDIKTFVDVSWQDGSTENNITSTLLNPISDLGDNGFFVGQYVLLNGQMGVVKSADPKENTTRVRWIDHPNEETILSSFQLKKHPIYNNCHGKLVYRPTSTKFEISYLSYFGSVIGFKEGHIEVRWADGTTSMVQPQALHGIDEDSSGDETEVVHGIDEDDYMSDSPGDETEVVETREDALSGDATEVVERREVASIIGLPEFLIDLLDFVDLSRVECLNESRVHFISNALEKDYREVKGLTLESIADGQLLIYIPFKQAIKLHFLVIQGPVEEGPKTVKLFANKEHFGFSDAIEVSPRDTRILSEDNLNGKPIILKPVRFQNIHSLTIFIENNQSGSELTRVQKIVLYGTLLQVSVTKGLYNSCWQFVRDKQPGKTKGYGFVRFTNLLDQAAALEEMNG